jgi:hypothetical protein
LRFIFRLNFIFKKNFFKIALSGCALAQEASQKRDISQRNVLQRGGNTTQELRSGAPFPLEVAPAEFYFPLEDESSRESCSGGVLQIHRALRSVYSVLYNTNTSTNTSLEQ